MLVSKVVCDVCGVVKGEGNKWLCVPVTYVETQVGKIIGVLHLGARPTEGYSKVVDVCTNTCLQTAIGVIIDRMRDSTNENKTNHNKVGP
jgi:hypothetical protein